MEEQMGLENLVSTMTNPHSRLCSVQDKDTLLPWLALNRLSTLGPVAQRQLLDAAGGMSGLCKVDPENLQRWLQAGQARQWLEFCHRTARSELLLAAEKDYAMACEGGMLILSIEHENYPTLLKQIHAAPSVLFVQGDEKNLHLPQIAVVGSRNASPSGLELAHEFSSKLGAEGLTITSGLALGIDGAAHRGALFSKAATIAVVATGLDQVYPRRHAGLAQEILASGGTIVSEFLPGTSPHAQNFPRRNRIISGLSLGTLVIEASLQSGSLITARYAMEQGREVFALPGSVRSAFHRGCHALIRQGATLVETTADIAEQLGGMLAFKKSECDVIKTLQEKADVWSSDALQVYKMLDHTPTGIDVLAVRCQLPIAILSAALLDLEMEGVVTQVHGFYSRC